MSVIGSIETVGKFLTPFLFTPCETRKCFPPLSAMWWHDVQLICWLEDRLDQGTTEDPTLPYFSHILQVWQVRLGQQDECRHSLVWRGREWRPSRPICLTVRGESKFKSNHAPSIKIANRADGHLMRISSIQCICDIDHMYHYGILICCFNQR